MMHLILSRGLLLLCCGYALTRGGAPERIVATSYLTGVIAWETVLGPLHDRFLGFEAGAFGVDFVLLLIFIAVALFADRFWPLWLSAMQAASLPGYLIPLVTQRYVNLPTAILVQMWFYPIMIMLAAGTMRHRWRSKEAGTEKSWSNSCNRSNARQAHAPMR